MGCGASHNRTIVEQFKPPKEREIQKSKPLLAHKPHSAGSLLGLRQNKEDNGFQEVNSGRQSVGTISKIKPTVQSAQSSKSAALRYRALGIGNYGSNPEQTGSKRVESAPVKRAAPNVHNATSTSLPLPLNEANNNNHNITTALPPKHLPPLRPVGGQGSIDRPVRADASKILESLREEGLLEATSKGISGLCYELPLDELQPAKRELPARLARLEKQATSKDLNLTRTQLKQRLDEADQRRKARETERVRRSREKDQRNLEVKLALLEIDRNLELAKMQSLEEDLNRKASRRSSTVSSVIARQRHHNEHIDCVRTRKLTRSQTRNSFEDNHDDDTIGNNENNISVQVM